MRVHGISFRRSRRLVETWLAASWQAAQLLSDQGRLASLGPAHLELYLGFHGRR